MRKTMLPDHLGIIFSIVTTFSDGEQEVEVGFSCVPFFMEDSINQLVDFSRSLRLDDKVPCALEPALRMGFFLRELDPNTELQVHKILYSDNIGRVQFN